MAYKMMTDKQSTTTITTASTASVVCSVKCRYCGILLVGREQFMGHMFHAHEFILEQLEAAWESITTAQRLGDVSRIREEIIR